jgi:hypothetical protein
MTREDAIGQMVHNVFSLDKRDFGNFVYSFIDMEHLEEALRKSIKNQYDQQKITKEDVDGFIEGFIDRS